MSSWRCFRSAHCLLSGCSFTARAEAARTPPGAAFQRQRHLHATSNSSSTCCFTQRRVRTTSACSFSTYKNPHAHDPTAVPLTFVVNGQEVVVSAPVDHSLLMVCEDAQLNEIEGACGGGLACSTCHLILPSALYAQLEPPSTRELDLLDHAPQSTDTSRLGCQVAVKPFFAHAKITVPSEFINQDDDV